MAENISSVNTRKMLVDCLKRQMLEKPLSKITVSSIIRECGCNRNTFYYHFEDMDALVKHMLDVEAVNQLREFDFHTDYRSAILFVIEYVESNRHLVNCMLDSYGREHMRRLLSQDISEIIVNMARTELAESGRSCPQEQFFFIVETLNDTLASMLVRYLGGETAMERPALVDYVEAFTRNYMTAALGAACIK